MTSPTLNIRHIDFNQLHIAIKTQISLENKHIISFLDLFRQYDDCLYGYYYNHLDISACFFEIIHLKNETLYQLLTILNEISKGLSYNELDLCRNDIERGIYDIKWIIDKNNLSKRIKNAFEQHENRIAHQRNIAEAFKLPITDFYQAKQISADFLNALDFYNLNNEDYFLALLFCMKVSIQNFELEQEPVLEFFIFYLSDKYRVEIADKDITELVTAYLILLKTLRSLYSFTKKDQACLDLWETRLTYFNANANPI